MSRCLLCTGISLGGLVTLGLCEKGTDALLAVQNTGFGAGLFYTGHKACAGVLLAQRCRVSDGICH